MTVLGARLIQDIWPTLTSEGALTAITYKSITPGAVTSSGLLSTSLGGSTYSTGVDVLIGHYRAFEVDGVRIQAGDRQVRFPSSVLSVTPTVDDELVVGSVTYRVTSVRQPTDGASWALQVRQP